LMLRPSPLRFALGLMILGNAINLLIFLGGRVSTEGPPLVATLPQCAAGA